MVITEAKKQELSIKHMKKFVGKSDLRPALKGIHYTKNGHVYATDSFHALRMKDIHAFPSTITIDPKTGAKIHEKYPDIESIFNNIELNDGNKIIVYDAELLAKQVKAILQLEKTMVPDDYTTILKIENGEAYFELHKEKFNLSTFVGTANESLNIRLGINTEHLHHIMDVFKDVKTMPLHIYAKEYGKPILFTDEQNGIDAIAMPKKV